MSEASRDAERLRDTGNWLRYAEEDLLLAEAIASDTNRIPRHACTNAQQAAEKALKGALVYLEVDFPWHHDLNALRNLLPADWSAVHSLPPLGSLTDWATHRKYPGDLPEATEADARAAVSLARQVYDAVAYDLLGHGFR
jgi:HEPN domain-containing protein